MKDLITSITNNGIILNTFYINKLKHNLSLIGTTDEQFTKYGSQFRRLVDHALVKENFFHILIFQILVLYIMTSIFSGSSMPYIYEFLSRNAVCSSTLKGWIKEQNSLFLKIVSTLTTGN